MGKIDTGIKTNLFNLYQLSTSLRNYLDRGVDAYDDIATNHIIAEVLERVWARAIKNIATQKQHGALLSKRIKFKISTAESEIITELIDTREVDIFQMMNQNLSNEYRNEQKIFTQNQIGE
jgi:hypothetical protein